jgi:hypothetical protein
MKKRALLIGAFLLAAIAVAQTTYQLTINGKASTKSAIVVGGETYVPLKALQAAGAQVIVANGSVAINFPVSGGSNQANAVEGGLNEWLFNGIWRLRVLSVAPATDGMGWEAKIEVRNGTKQDELALDGTGFDSLKLVLSDGKMLEGRGTSDLTSHSFPQGGGETFTLTFADEELASHKPDKLILFIKPDADLTKYMKDRLKVGYTVPDPSFRIKLGS